ncbi:MAG TPA: hypothetical protein VGC44_08065 [Longimicrobiales bacterium]
MAPRSARFALVVPWLTYAAVLACISFVENSFTESMRRLLDPNFNWIDLSFHLVVWLGLVVAVLWSVIAAGFGSRTSRRLVTGAGILAASFIGPILGIIAVWSLAEDVDGIWLMLNAPILGVLIASVALCVVAFREWLRNRKAASRPNGRA